MIDENIEAIRTACERHGVVRLEIFGSATDHASFDPQTSDVDFIVTFAKGVNLGPWLAGYFDLRDELERVLGRSVDLVMQGAMRNPHFVREAKRTRRVVYAAKGAQAAFFSAFPLFSASPCLGVSA